MLNLYRYMVQNGMKKLEDVPQPYQDMLRAEMAPAPAPEQPVDTTTTETPAV